MQLDPSKIWLTGAPPPALPAAADIEAHGSLVAFQIHVRDVLRAFLPLAPVTAQPKPGACTYADKRTVASEVESALRSIGISMVVALDAGTRKSAAPHAVCLDPFTFAVAIAENPVTNRGASGTGVTASRAAELAMICLSGLPLGNGVCAVQSYTLGGEEGQLQTAEVTFQTAYTITPPASMLAEE